MPNPDTGFDQEDTRDVTLVTFRDKKLLYEGRIQVIGYALFELVDTHGRRKLGLNFARVEFVSSDMLAKLITLRRKIAAVHGRLVLYNIRKEIREVFEITKLDKDFTLAPDEQAAMEHLFS